MADTKQAKLKDLEFDKKNFNKHTEFGMSLLEKSLRNNGAGRSILIDKNNRIIGGNGVVEVAGQIGLENVRIVESVALVPREKKPLNWQELKTQQDI